MDRLSGTVGPGTRRTTDDEPGCSKTNEAHEVKIVAASAIRWSFDHGGPSANRGPWSTSFARSPKMSAASASTFLAS